MWFARLATLLYGQTFRIQLVSPLHVLILRDNSRVGRINSSCNWIFHVSCLSFCECLAPSGLFSHCNDREFLCSRTKCLDYINSCA